MECYRLDKEAFNDILRRRPEIAEDISHILARRRVELEAVREGLNEEAKRQRMRRAQGDLLHRIRSFFTLGSDNGKRDDGWKKRAACCLLKQRQKSPRLDGTAFCVLFFRLHPVIGVAYLQGAWHGFMWRLGGLTEGLQARLHDIGDDVFGARAVPLLFAPFRCCSFSPPAGLFAEAGTELRENLLNYLGSVMPGSAYDLVHTTVDEISKATSGGKLSFGVLATLWAASNGMGAISESLNVAYNVKEQRPWWKARLMSIGLTMALAVLIISALTLMLYGGEIAEGIAASYGFGSAFTIAWKIVQWPIVLLFVLLSFSLIYYFAPDLRDQDWKWVTPGSAIALVLWLLVSFAFRAYLKYFDSYSATYGSLGAVIIMMLWFYCRRAILIGGEINSEIENAAAEAGAPDAKERGEKAPTRTD